MKKVFLACLFVLMLTAVPVWAQPNNIIQSVRISGAERVEENTIRSYLTLKEGDSFDAVEIDESLKRLFATELFSDIRIRREGQTLVIELTENPIVNRISFEGNKRLRDEDLEKEVQLRPRLVLTSKKVMEDTKRITDIYRRSGRFNATVEPKIIKREQNRVDLVFEINEGDVTQVRRIIFKGNENFSDSTLREEISTKEAAWWRVLSGGDTYDPDRLNFDKELLRRFYLKEGYADFKVNSAVAELSPDRSEFYITYDLEEGERYKVGSVSVKSPLKDLDADILESQIKNIESGDWYNAVKVDDTISTLTDFLGDRGYAFINIDADVDRNPENRTLDLTFELEEGPKVYVERIDIEGNVRTKDYVIRREFELVEGDAFNASKIRETRRNLTNLGYFKNIDIEPTPGSAPDRTVVKAEIEEQSTGELSFGAGFSTYDSLLGNIRLRERNLLGRGQDLRLSGTLSGRRSEIDLSFTEPYFLGRKLSAGFDVFHTTRQEDENESRSNYDEKRVGGALRIGYQINDDTSQTLRYQFEEVSIENVDADASTFIRQQQGTNTTGEVSQSLLYDKRDNRFDPSNGYYLRLGTAVAGLGGNVKYLKGTLDGGYYLPLAEDFIFSQTFNSGIIEGYSDDNVRIANRFFLGGQNLRGFEPAGVGPRDLATNDALGGNFYWTVTTETKFPTFLPDDLGVSASVFMDAGVLESIDDSGPTIEDSGSIRASVGVGLSWRSPFGPIRIDYAVPVAKEDYDEEQTVQFNFGTQF